MVTVSRTATTAVFEVEGLDKRWALRSRREIPLAHLTGVRADPSVATGWWHGLRLGGTNDRGRPRARALSIAEERNMESTESTSNASLYEILSARALRTPMDRLVIDLLGGSLLLAASVWAQPTGWVVLASAATCFLSYGSWAIAERRLQPRPWPESIPFESLLRALQVVASVLGIAAFALLLFATLGLALGTIIS